MTEITHEALEALSKKATQGVWEFETDPYGAPFPGIVHHGSPFEFADFSVGENGDENQANAELCIALVNAYRTGQLILAQPIRPAPCMGLAQNCPWVEGQTQKCSCEQPSGDEVEAVAMALAEFECANWDAQTLNETPTGETPEEMRQGYLEKATAAIARLDAHRGKQACLTARENSDG